MRRILSVFLALAMVIGAQPLLFAAARAQQNLGEIAGTAVVEGKPLHDITVRLRNVDSGVLVGTMVTNQRGEFRFTGLPVGNFVVETVAPNGTLLGTSVRISLVAGAMLATGITVSTSAAAAAALGVGAATAAGTAGTTAGAAGAAAGAGAAGAGAAGAAAGAGAAGAAAGAAAAGGAFLATTAGIVTAVAVGVGVTAAVVATTNDASPSGG